MSEFLATCVGLTKRYGQREALSKVSLQLEPGRIIGLLGPNGSGKTTFIKLLCGLLQPTDGSITIDGMPVGPHSKSVVSYLPDKMYYADWMRVSDLFDLFADFYADFDRPRAETMCLSLGIAPSDRIKTMSKGTKEKVQLVLVMARRAKLYLLDEPIAGVDPAAREFIMNTILTNYDEKASILISTHLISDVEPVLDEAIFLREGQVVLHDNADALREREGKSLDALFREVFRAQTYEGGAF